ncbi:Putative uncharacterized protein [Escherichia coli D6-117.29]|nr:Putative uncharacterized protein [Escherichia coli D6-117.29]
MEDESAGVAGVV